ncbi:MAG: hypothetical protein C0617_10740 [Desulfuromonas sp.]|uniref:hypothetical protein n=1 Tax=Desulfuromonas sp. TaxID=892 RepID=UPI000CB6CDC6|nr:hypothetical protein [Desulfuromonas sp.]PLX83608.1 MAG: hypothetical protein C0617_10740 [Desulfuromonas sp.]
MTCDARKICPLCAWRANCVKRFSMGDDSTLHCPDFSEDVALRKAKGMQPTDAEDSAENAD